MPGTEFTVAEIARRSMRNLTPAERRVARALLAAYPVAGLESIAELARRAEVSGPTVMRFAVKLGYDRYPDFQQALKDEMLARGSTPALQISARSLARESPLARAQAAFAAAIQRTFSGLPPDDFAGCVALLSDARRPVTVVAGRFSGGLAEYFTGHLHQVRPRASLVHSGPFGQIQQALDMGRRDVLVAFDFRRYQKETIDFAKGAHRQGAAVILVTDPWLSPIAEIADYVLPAVIEAASPFDTLVPAFAVVDMVVAAVIERIGDAAEHRVRELEDFAGPRDGLWTDHGD
jgi:DNA-binding MurR/RpiR family transcriptional regulator